MFLISGAITGIILKAIGMEFFITVRREGAVWRGGMTFQRLKIKPSIMRFQHRLGIGFPPQLYTLQSSADIMVRTIYIQGTS